MSLLPYFGEIIDVRANLHIFCNNKAKVLHFLLTSCKRYSCDHICNFSCAYVWISWLLVLGVFARILKSTVSNSSPLNAISIPSSTVPLLRANRATKKHGQECGEKNWLLHLATDPVLMIFKRISVQFKGPREAHD